ncbi:hypothetical protein Lfu02_78850 [Longispora fulva]|nr:hypothetical protein Lfu02_78850 [Longispora fulva]
MTFTATWVLAVAGSGALVLGVASPAVADGGCRAGDRFGGWQPDQETRPFPLGPVVSDRGQVHVG